MTTEQNEQAGANSANGFDLDTAPDISAIEDEGTVVHLHDELDNPMYYTDGTVGDGAEVAARRLPVTITVVGTYSQTYRAAFAELTKKWNKRARQGQDVTRDKDDPEIVAKCVKRWQGIFAKGKPLPCTEHNAFALLSHAKAQHHLKRVDAAMKDHERFFSTGSGD